MKMLRTKVLTQIRSTHKASLNHHIPFTPIISSPSTDLESPNPTNPTGDWSRAGIGTQEYDSVSTGKPGQARPYAVLAKGDPESDAIESEGKRLRYGGLAEWADVNEPPEGPQGDGRK